MGELSKMDVSETVDVLGRVCPYPLVMTKKALEKLQSGAVLKVVTDAPASAEDTIPRFCEKQGYSMECIKLEDTGCWEIYIQKK